MKTFLEYVIENQLGVKQRTDMAGKGIFPKDGAGKPLKKHLFFKSPQKDKTTGKTSMQPHAKIGATADTFRKEEKQKGVDGKVCWKGYKRMGTKKKGGKTVDNCVPIKEVSTNTMANYSQAAQQSMKKDSSPENVKKRTKGLANVGKRLGFKAFNKKLNEDDKPNKTGDDAKGHKRPTEDGAGLTAKGVAAHRRANPGSKLQTAVTTPPSKLKKGSKAAKRRKSFCARSKSWTGERGKAARRRWNC